jgi:hypothetical protein
LNKDLGPNGNLWPSAGVAVPIENGVARNKIDGIPCGTILDPEVEDWKYLFPFPNQQFALIIPTLALQGTAADTKRDRPSKGPGIATEVLSVVPVGREAAVCAESSVTTP